MANNMASRFDSYFKHLFTQKKYCSKRSQRDESPEYLKIILKEMFLLYYIDSDVISGFKYSIANRRDSRCERVNSIITETIISKRLSYSNTIYDNEVVVS